MGLLCHMLPILVVSSVLEREGVVRFPKVGIRSSVHRPPFCLETTPLLLPSLLQVNYVFTASKHVQLPVTIRVALWHLLAMLVGTTASCDVCLIQEVCSTSCPIP